jgi:hypothetical protein
LRAKRDQFILLPPNDPSRGFFSEDGSLGELSEARGQPVEFRKDKNGLRAIAVTSTARNFLAAIHLAAAIIWLN